jgi:hypothetical protein
VVRWDARAATPSNRVAGVAEKWSAIAAGLDHRLFPPA